MRRFTSSLGLFAAGMMFGVTMIHTGAAQEEKPVNLGLRVNHVGIYTKNFEESIKFYTKATGFRDAFVFRDKDGKPTTMYVQVSQDTFLELAPATAEHPAGLNHIGFRADDLKDTVAKLRQQGIKIDDPRMGQSKASLTNMTDPDGVRLEMVEFLPDSLQTKAIESWN
jgi:catechol 2,3-dioxygenase-like lactoylglutathione lyase family enzyme